MSTPTLEELQQEETAADLLSTLLGIASAVGLKVTSWAVGAVTRTILAIVANNLESLSTIQVILVNSGFLDFATGTWLTALADQVYDVERIQATAAAGAVTLSNSTAADIPVDANGLHVANDVSGKTYTSTNTTVEIIPAGGSVTIDIIADTVGASSDAAPGDITTIVNDILGVTCTNALPVLGSDEQTDEDLRTLCRESLGAVSPNGPSEAYSYVAKTTEGLTLPITRVRVSKDQATGIVTTLLANVDGPPSGGDVTIVEANILRLAVPLGVTPIVSAATDLSQAVTCEVFVENSTLTDPEIEALIGTALARLVSTLPIGGYLIDPPDRYIDAGMIEKAIFGALAEIKSVDLTVPAADIPINADEVLTLGTVTVTITRL